LRTRSSDWRIDIRIVRFCPRIVKLLLELAAVCSRYQDETLRNLPCKRLQCDEIWSFVGGKDKNLPQEKREAGLGSV
jgi:hypothetical protein